MNSKFIISITLLLSVVSLNADPVVTFFLKEYPEAGTKSALLSQIKQPDGIAQRSLEKLSQTGRTAGIFSSYFGFLNVSDYNGQTTFPRKQSNAALKVVITDKVIPIMMFESTVSHWELIPGTPATLYNVVQKEDPSTQLTYWNASKGDLPKDNRLSPTDTIIIFAKPNHIYLPLGASLSQQGPNLILPDIYIKKGIQRTRNALYVLNLSFLFRPIDLLYKKEPQSYEFLVETE